MGSGSSFSSCSRRSKRCSPPGLLDRVTCKGPCSKIPASGGNRSHRGVSAVCPTCPVSVSAALPTPGSENPRSTCPKWVGWMGWSWCRCAFSCQDPQDVHGCSVVGSRSTVDTLFEGWIDWGERFWSRSHHRFRRHMCWQPAKCLGFGHFRSGQTFHSSWSRRTFAVPVQWVAARWGGSHTSLCFPNAAIRSVNSDPHSFVTKCERKRISSWAVPVNSLPRIPWRTVCYPDPQRSPHWPSDAPRWIVGRWWTSFSVEKAVSTSPAWAAPPDVGPVAG